MYYNVKWSETASSDALEQNIWSRESVLTEAGGDAVLINFVDF